MREIYMMKCGHASNAKVNGKIGCGICGCTEIDHKIEDPKEGLEGRQARCSDCGHKTASRWDLAFFKYQPDSEYDSFYDGCYGWD